MQFVIGYIDRTELHVIQYLVHKKLSLEPPLRIEHGLRCYTEPVTHQHPLKIFSRGFGPDLRKSYK